MNSLPTSSDRSRVYFPGFNAVRLLAATVVIVHHIEQLKYLSGLTPNIWKNPIIHAWGPQGVNLFFVLSGFLITYLVCEEKHRTGRIAVGHFYMRRALKILPLYFLISSFALIVAPFVFGHWVHPGQNPALRMVAGDMRALQADHAVKSAFYFLMLPHVALLIYYPPPLFVSQTWSVGVEEHFYLAWPWVLKIDDRKLLKVLFALIVIKLLTREMIVSFPNVLSFGSATGKTLLDFTARYLDKFRVECMAIGGVGAMILREPRWRRLIPLAPGLFFVALCAALTWGYEWSVVPSLIYMAALLSLATLPEGGPLRRCLEQNQIRYLGSLSYGLYMYHPIAIVVGLITATAWASGHSVVFFNAVLYATTFASVAALSVLSFHLLEAPLLRLKGRLGSVSASVPQQIAPEERTLAERLPILPDTANS